MQPTVPSLPLESQIHLMKVSVILNKWLCWLKLVTVIKHEILIFKYQPLYSLKQPALGNYCAFFIICLFIYFKYFPSILIIYIIFEDSIGKQR